MSFGQIEVSIDGFDRSFCFMAFWLDMTCSEAGHRPVWSYVLRGSYVRYRDIRVALVLERRWHILCLSKHRCLWTRPLPKISVIDILPSIFAIIEICFVSLAVSKLAQAKNFMSDCIQFQKEIQKFSHLGSCCPKCREVKVVISFAGCRGWVRKQFRNIILLCICTAIVLLSSNIFLISYFIRRSKSFEIFFGLLFRLCQKSTRKLQTQHRAWTKVSSRWEQKYLNTMKQWKKRKENSRNLNWGTYRLHW